MLRLLKSDFYKLFKLKSFFIILLICFVLAVGQIVLSYTSNETLKGKSYTDEQGETISLYDETLNFNKSAEWAFGLSSVMLVSIVVALLIAGEFGYGTIKNTASKGFSRNAIFTSKLVTASVLQLLFMLGYAGGTLITSAIIWGTGSTDGAFWIELVKTAGLHSLINIAFAAIFTMISFIVRQSGGSIALNICVLQFSMIGVQLLQLLFDKVFGLQIDFAQYWVGGIAQEVSVSSLTNDLVLRGSVVSVGYFIGASLLGILIFNKRDIK